MRLLAALLVAAAVVAASGRAASAADIVCRPAGPPRATVLLLHAGAWYLGNPLAVSSDCLRYAASGYRAIGVDYPLLNVAGSLRYATRLALRWRRARGPLFAVGESAGGTLALDLALARRVDAAVAVAAPSNLLTWAPRNFAYWHGTLHLDHAERRRLSPYYRRAGHSAPILLWHSPDDDSVPYAQSVAFARRLGAARLCPLHGTHLRDHSYELPSLRWLRSWPALRAPAGCRTRAA